MIKRKISIILQTFSQDELQKLEDYAKSPYFNKDEKLVLLLQYISNVLAKKWINEERKFNDELALKKVFGSKAAPKNAINQLCSNLLRLTENFIYQEGLSFQNPTEYKKDLAIKKSIDLNKFYVNRSRTNEDIIKLVQNDIDKGEVFFEQIFSDYSYRNADYYYYRFLFSYRQSNFLSSMQSAKGIEIGATIHNFTVYYILVSLRLLCLSTNRKALFNEKQNFQLQDEVEKLATEAPYSEILSIKLWYAALKLFKNPNVENYHQLKNLLWKNDLTHLHSEELYTLLSALNNQSAMVVAPDDLYAEMFEIVEFMEVNDVILAQGYLPENKFRNIITTALNLKNTHWAEQFLEKYKDSIHSQYTEDVYFTLKVKILFKQKKYDEALNILQEKIKNFPNLIFKTEVIYTMPIQIAYEQEDDILDTYLERFNSFLHYNQDNLNERPKTAFLNFKNRLNQIKNYHSSLRLDSIEKQHLLDLEADITKIHNQELAEKEWLLEKIRELKVRFKVK